MSNVFRIIFGPNPKPFPEIIPLKIIKIGSFQFNNIKIIMLIVSVILAVVLQFIVYGTKIGKAMRATSYDLEAAMLMGIMPGLKAFVAAVLGGIGIIPGAMLGGILMGISETFTKAYISTSLSDAIVFGLLIVKLKLLLLDEPSMGLAPLIVKDIFTIIKEINKLGTTVLLVEQNAHAALHIADRAYVLETGSIVLEGDAKALLTDDKVKEAYLGD